MTVETRPLDTDPITSPARQSARDRLLAALEVSPRLSAEDAAFVSQAVQEAREASLADELPS